MVVISEFQGFGDPLTKMDLPLPNLALAVDHEQQSLVIFRLRSLGTPVISTIICCADSHPDRDLSPEAEAERRCNAIGRHARGLTSFVAPGRSDCSLWGKTWFVLTSICLATFGAVRSR